MAWAAIVLAGGRGARLGGVEKASLELDGRPLLARAVDALVGAEPIVVVGPEVPGVPAAYVREEPAYGGPVAGLVAGWAAVVAEAPPIDHLALVAVVAVDMPHLTPDTWTRLRRAAEATDRYDGAVLVGPDGRRQIALVVAADRLAAVLPEAGEAAGRPLWRTLAPLELAEVKAVAREARDVDTWADLG
jgi:molybdopterin-guanine dinucleotide biosynthesis protein A